MPETIPVDLGSRSYEVLVGSDLLEMIGSTVTKLTAARQAVVISETVVGPLYADRAVQSLQSAGLRASRTCFPAGETNKTLATTGVLFDSLFAIQPAIDRGTLIVGLGGGVATDVAGFVAATTLRGLRWVACPTSLLAAVDASVGGKTGVDHKAGKNLIGAFHQPAGVLIDVETLRTLKRVELVNGLAECVKHAVIRQAELLQFLDENADDLLSGGDGKLTFDATAMTDLIARNVRIKADVVAEDERESGVRAHLNFGHTIGHAIELSVGYDRLRHGEAVALGMLAENELAARRGLLAADDARQIEEVLARLDLPIRQPGLNADAIWRIMQHDKKNRDGKVRMVLAGGIGRVDIYDDITEQEVRDAITVLTP